MDFKLSMSALIWLSLYSITVGSFSDTLLPNVRTIDVKTVDVLLRHGANLQGTSLTGRVPLDYAIQNQNLELVRYFIAQGADVNYIQPPGENNFYTMTQWCLMSKEFYKEEKLALSLDLMKILLEAGADPNQQNFYGRTISFRYRTD